MVEALSGRSSNMQRHIRTCEFISPGDRARIMANFEASQAASRTSKDHDPVDDNYSRLPVGSVPGPPISPSPYGSSAGRSRAISHSDDDGTSSSSISSPEMGRNEIFARPVSQASSSSAVSRPSRRLTLRSILNEDSETPPYPYNSSAAKERAAAAVSGTTTHGFNAAPASPELATEQALSFLTKLDLAIDEIQHVRNRLEDHIGPHGGQHLRSSEECTAMIAWLRKSLDDARRENDWLKQRFASMKTENGGLKARLEMVGEKLRHVEVESRRVLFGNGDRRIQDGP
ncbi:hypothetical protein K440DRAFT_639744 [Wilcoxina mikolae CBS 423.85]|nr:hypothetical protein K440DRAFT_639744 [Wilcoxina mikolae CBS 423.85]